MVIVLAHPLFEAGGLPVPPAFVGALAAVLAVALARALPARPPAPPTPAPATSVTPAPDPAFVQGSGAALHQRLERTRRASWWFWPCRAFGVAVLALAIVAGRVGDSDELENIAPALAVGLAWPVLLAAALLGGQVWAWLNPYDTLARGLERVAGGGSGNAAEPRAAHPRSAAVWPAAVAAFAWSAYLAFTVSGGLRPRVVGTVLAGYTIVTLGGCLARGRERWLGEGELLTVLLGAVGRRGGLVTWAPPRGWPALAGVLAGSLLMAALRPSTLWSGVAELGLAPAGAVAVWGGVALCAGLGWLGVRSASRWARTRGDAGAVVAALVPVLAGLGIAFALTRDRLVTSAQLVVIRASDPLGQGLDLFGTADFPLRANLLTESTRVAIQVTVLVAAGAWGAVIARRRAARRRASPEPALVTVGAVVALAAIAVSAV